MSRCPVLLHQGGVLTTFLLSDGAVSRFPSLAPCAGDALHKRALPWGLRRLARPPVCLQELYQSRGRDYLVVWPAPAAMHGQSECYNKCLKEFRSEWPWFEIVAVHAPRHATVHSVPALAQHGQAAQPVFAEHLSMPPAEMTRTGSLLWCAARHSPVPLEAVPTVASDVTPHIVRQLWLRPLWYARRAHHQHAIFNVELEATRDAGPPCRAPPSDASDSECCCTTGR